MVDGPRNTRVERITTPVEPREAAQTPQRQRPLPVEDEDTFVGATRTITTITPTPRPMELSETTGRSRQRLTPLRTAGSRDALQWTTVRPEPQENLARLAARHFGHPLSDRSLAALEQATGIGRTESLPEQVQIPSTGELYLLTHSAERRSRSRMVEGARFVVVDRNQSWEALLENHYGTLPEDIAPHAAALLATANDRSLWEPLPDLVVLPALEALERTSSRIPFVQRAYRQAEQRGSDRDLSLVREMGGSLQDPAPIPTAGRAYRPDWSDNLRGVVLHAYREQLSELEPAAAEQRLELMMHAIAGINDVGDPRLGLYGAIYLPNAQTLDAVLDQLTAAPDAERALRSSPMWRHIRGAGREARADALRLTRPTRRHGGQVGNISLRQAPAQPAPRRLAPTESAAARVLGEGDAPPTPARAHIRMDADSGNADPEAPPVDIAPEDTAEDVVDNNALLAHGAQRLELVATVRETLSIHEIFRQRGWLDEQGRLTIVPQGDESATAALRRVLREIGVVPSVAALFVASAEPQLMETDDGSYRLNITDVLATQLYGGTPQPRTSSSSAYRELLRTAVHQACGLEVNPLSMAPNAPQETLDHELERALEGVGVKRADVGEARFEALRRELLRRLEARQEVREEVRSFIERLQDEAKMVAQSLIRMMRARGDSRF